MDRDYMVARFDRAIKLLPYGLREKIRRLDKESRASAEEIRLRTGKTPTVLIGGREREFSDVPVTRADLDMLMDIATQVSGHAVQSSMINGYITSTGGFRIGIGGSVYMKDGAVGGYRNITSAAVRISRELLGIGSGLAGQLFENGIFRSTLIVSPPGCGKTTLLRDLIRIISDRGVRVSLVDERGEIAAVFDGMPQFDVGTHTDVLEGCPKAQGITMMTRAMNPQIIAVDEITDIKDVEAMINASNCGIGFLATAHAERLGDLKSRPIYRSLLHADIFKNIIYINKSEDRRTYKIERTGAEND